MGTRDLGPGPPGQAGPAHSTALFLYLDRPTREGQTHPWEISVLSSSRHSPSMSSKWPAYVEPSRVTTPMVRSSQCWRGLVSGAGREWGARGHGDLAESRRRSSWRTCRSPPARESGVPHREEACTQSPPQLCNLALPRRQGEKERQLTCQGRVYHGAPVHGRVRMTSGSEREGERWGAGRNWLGLKPSRGRSQGHHVGVGSSGRPLLRRKCCHLRFMARAARTSRQPKGGIRECSVDPPPHKRPTHSPLILKGPVRTHPESLPCPEVGHSVMNGVFGPGVGRNTNDLGSRGPPHRRLISSPWLASLSKWDSGVSHGSWTGVQRLTVLRPRVSAGMCGHVMHDWPHSTFRKDPLLRCLIRSHPGLGWLQGGAHRPA